MGLGPINFRRSEVEVREVSHARSDGFVLPMEARPVGRDKVVRHDRQIPPFRGLGDEHIRLARNAPLVADLQPATLRFLQKIIGEPLEAPIVGRFMKLGAACCRARKLALASPTRIKGTMSPLGAASRISYLMRPPMHPE